MARIAFILLCHKDPDAIIRQAEMLTAVGDYMSIHFDARAKTEHYRKIRSALADNPNVTFARKRIRCGWGEWSLVQASIYAAKLDYARALTAIEKAISMEDNPKEPWYQLKLAAHYELEQFPQAAQTLARAHPNWWVVATTAGGPPR